MNSNSFDPQPIILSGSRVHLEPLSLNHAPDLLRAGQEESLWLYMPRPKQNLVEETEAWISDALAAQEKGAEVAFAIIDINTNQVVGSTRYLDIHRTDRNLEIGWTWLAAEVHGRAANPECKLLLMQHAFEALGAVRVQLKCDERNLRSQRAMEKLGFFREGVLRKTRLCWDGHIRNTVYFSVLEEEWPQVKLVLQSFASK